VRKFVGQSSITGKVYNVDDFVSGYVFAWVNLLVLSMTLNCLLFLS
jgi:hypothetical protein